MDVRGQFLRGSRVWLCCFLCAGVLGSARGETKVDFWHSYVHQPSGVVHYSFHIASYKRGVFFGSCGPSTRSLRWGYEIDLAGPGPVYQKDQIAMRSDLSPVEVSAGTIRIEPGSNRVVFDLQLQGTNTIAFPGNGTYPIKKLK